jgi:translation initiation factor IF-2
MAKIRVNELAKELNMKPNVLLDKLVKMNISVRSHVSPLEDDVVAKLRAEVRSRQADGGQAQDKKTVIRRQKRRYPKKPIASETISDPQIRKEGHPPETESEKDTEAEHNPVSEGKETPSIPEKEDKKEFSGTAVPKADDSRQPFGKREEKNYSGGDKKQRFRPDKNAQPPKFDKSGRKKKRIRKDMPAKIIKLPTPEEVKAAEISALAKKTEAENKKAPVAPRRPERPEKPERRTERPERSDRPERPEKQAHPPDVPPVTPAPEKTDRKKKNKKWKKTPEEESADKNFSKKKITFKRKEVVEGAELYAGGEQQRIRKAKKAAKAKPVQPIHQKTLITTPKAIKRRVKIDETIILSDLAKRMGFKASEMIAKLMGLGVMATVNQTIDFDTAVLVASEFGYEVERAAFEEENLLKTSADQDDPEKMIHRAPVVTIMGHVDHGKTSLLDVIRKTKVTEIEAGGITQHIGAYSVKTDRGQITFLDTPGHEAFTAMRARGAKVTDIVVLVVAADDGVMPQTIEAINHSKAAGVPIIVAVNKIDKPGADMDRVVRQLSDHGLMPEEWGGTTIFVKVSAKQKIGLDELLEMILLQAEVLELKANPEKLAVGYVVEAKLDSGRGPVATILVQQGTMKNGDPVVCGIHHGKVRAMINDVGHQVEIAGPSIPVEVLGLSGVPNAGDELITLADEKSAKQVSLHRIQKQRAKELAKTSRMSLEKLFERMKQGEVKSLNLIVKADVQGSIEALSDSLKKLSNQEVSINIVHSATGTITESDISLAAVSDAIIIGFNVRPSAKVQGMATEEHVDMRFYNIIYNAIKDVQDAILGMMSSKFEERVLGRAEVRQVFFVPKIGAIAGCGVTDGKIQRGQLIRLVRDGVVMHEGKISSLRRLKDDVKEVQSGYECGIGIENYNDVKVGDVIECYYMEEIKPELGKK